MGAVLAKFRREKTTYQILEKLEQEIKDIEEYSVNTQAAQRRYVGNFLLISIGLYVLGFIIFYFVFFPPTWSERITFFIPLLIFPIVIFFLKKVVTWYFQRKINKNSKKLNALRAEKKKVIEQVMDKETYKVAVEILNRFDKTNGLKPTGAITPRVAPSSVVPIQKGKELALPSSQTNQLITPRLSMPSSLQTLDRPLTSPLSSLGQMPNAPRTLVPRSLNQSLQVHRKRTPYPIINEQEKGVMEKLVDFLIGDGAQNRFAMICKECFAHNGMALQEEYEYAAFRCAFCNTMNPAKKCRPIGPKLYTGTPQTTITEIGIRKSSSSSSTSSGEKYSGSEDDEDEKNITPTKPDEPSQATAEPTEVEEDSSKLEKTTEEKKND